MDQDYTRSIVTHRSIALVYVGVQNIPVLHYTHAACQCFNTECPHDLTESPYFTQTHARFISHVIEQRTRLYSAKGKKMKESAAMATQQYLIATGC